MGQEIERADFVESDFDAYAERLARETGALVALLESGALSNAGYVAGLELEACLIDHAGFPAPRNTEVLAALDDPLVVPELSRFNLEFNVAPAPVEPGALGRLESELSHRWAACQAVCHGMGLALVAIGILPTLRNADLCPAHITPTNRYLALNEQILRQRRGRPLRVRIEGREPLDVTHHDVMMEAAATSFQAHIKLPLDDALRYYNASLIASAPLLAASGNSPFLFQHDLWAETRIPLFEQSCDFTGPPGRAKPLHRTTFGSGYLRDSAAEYFRENLDAFPVLLPLALDEPPARFPHLRLHNGTIWRWNRLLVGFEDDGTPHLRIEQRVLPAGPSFLDATANFAFYLGMLRVLATLERPPERDLGFQQARAGFYAAARDGLDARIAWLDGKSQDVRPLILEELLPMARQGLRLFGLHDDEIRYYLQVVERRVDSGQTGAIWQRGFVARHGPRYLPLLNEYRARQMSGAPVYDWDYA